MDKKSVNLILQVTSWILAMSWIGIVVLGQLVLAPLVMIAILLMRAQDFQEHRQHYSRSITLFTAVWGLVVLTLSGYLAYNDHLLATGSTWGIRLLLLVFLAPWVAVVGPVEWRRFRDGEDRQTETLSNQAVHQTGQKRPAGDR